MDALTDDARLVLQQLFQCEIDVRLKIDEIKSGSEEVAPHSLLQNIRSKLAILKVKIKEQMMSEAEDFLSQQHQLHSEELQTLQQQLRSALNVQTEVREKEERAALLAGSEVRKRNKDVRTIAGDITSRMQRNTQMLASMVRQQEDTVKNLATSSSELNEVDTEYKTLSSVLISSHRLVAKYGRRAMTDTFLTYLGFFLFLCTVLYVIQKRLFS